MRLESFKNQMAKLILESKGFLEDLQIEAPLNHFLAVEVEQKINHLEGIRAMVLQMINEEALSLDPPVFYEAFLEIESFIRLKRRQWEIRTERNREPSRGRTGEFYFKSFIRLKNKIALKVTHLKQ